MKNVLILSSSPRQGSNSDLLCDEFLRGALVAGHAAQKIRLADLKLNPASPATTASAMTASACRTTACRRSSPRSR